MYQTNGMPEALRASPSKNPRFIPHLTGLRGVTAMWVVLVHYRHAFQFSPLIATVFPNRLVNAPQGQIVMDFFFLLSGFVITLTAAKWNGENRFSYFKSFMRKRFARAYPLHLVTTLLMVGIVPFMYPAKLVGTPWASSLLLHLTLTQSWGIHLLPDWNFPSWSLSADWLSYLCFPFILGLNRKCNKTLSSTLLSITLGALSAMAVCYWFADGTDGRGFEIGWSQCLAEFWVGMSLYDLSQRWESRFSKTALDIFALGWIAAFSAMIIFDWSPIVTAPMAVVGMLSMALGSQIWRILLANRFIFVLGEISYCLYLLHWPIGRTFLRLWAGYFGEGASLANGITAAVLTIVLMGGLSYLTYIYFELPMRRLLSGSN